MLIENLSDKKVKTLRIDNGLEFVMRCLIVIIKRLEAKGIKQLRKPLNRMELLKR